LRIACHTEGGAAHSRAGLCNEIDKAFDEAPACSLLGPKRLRSTPSAVPSNPAAILNNRMEGFSMQWTTPSFSDMRFGFEITMYVATR
jgi:coenzyme PQQ precursor peptide PqqA